MAFAHSFTSFPTPHSLPTFLGSFSTSDLHSVISSPLRSFFFYPPSSLHSELGSSFGERFYEQRHSSPFIYRLPLFIYHYPVFIHRLPLFSFRYLRFPSPNPFLCIALIALHLPLAMVVLLSLIPISMSWLAKCVTTLSQNRVERVCASSNRVHCHSFVHVCFPFFLFRFRFFRPSCCHYTILRVVGRQGHPVHPALRFVHSLR